MAGKSSLLGCLLGLALLSIYSPDAAAQSPTATTVNEFLVEADVHLQLTSHMRMLSFIGLDDTVGYPFQQWYIATGLGYQFKPILRPHAENINRDKEHYLTFGSGYEYLRTTQLGKEHDENRIGIDVTPSFRPTSTFLLRDRNRTELRWINGAYSTTFRTQPSVERDCHVANLRFTPYGNVELFYDGSKHSWDQKWYTVGIQWPFKRFIQLDTYYQREHCPSCNPENWNVGGAVLQFFFGNKK